MIELPEFVTVGTHTLPDGTRYAYIDEGPVVVFGHDDQAAARVAAAVDLLDTDDDVNLRRIYATFSVHNEACDEPAADRDDCEAGCGEYAWWADYPVAKETRGAVPVTLIGEDW